MKTDKLIIGLIIALIAFAVIPFISLVHSDGWWGATTTGASGYWVSPATSTLDMAGYDIQDCSTGTFNLINSTDIVIASVDDAVTPSIRFGDGDTGIYEATDDILGFAINGAQDWRMNASRFQSESTTGPNLEQTGASDTVPTVSPRRNDTDTGIGSSGADILSIIAGGTEILRLIQNDALGDDIIINGSVAVDGSSFTVTASKVSIGTTTLSAPLRSHGTVQITAGGYPTSSQGLELSWAATKSNIASYDRDNTNYEAMQFQASQYNWQIGGVDKLTLGTDGSAVFASSVTVGNYRFPWADGANTQVLKTNGSGVLAWAADADSGGAPEGTTVLSTGEGGGTKFLREDGDGTSSWQAAAGGGDLLADASVPMTANWDIGNFDITLKALTGDGTIEGATITEGGNAVYSSGETPSGQLGGTYANITVDDLFLKNTADDTTAYKIEVSTLEATDAIYMNAVKWNAGDTIDGEQLGADTVDNDSIDWGDMTDLTTDGALDADVVEEDHIADDGIDSEHYNNGSIDAVHLAADIIDETKIADNGIDSEHYNDDSIDDAHLNFGVGANQISLSDFTNDLALTSSNVFVGNGSNVATGVAMSGDITITNAGVTAIGGNKVQLAELDVSDVSDDIAGDIAEGELTDQSVVTADIKEGTILVGDMAANSIDSAQYVDNSIDFDHMNWGNITKSFGVTITTCTASMNIPLKPFAYAVTITTITAICNIGTATIDVFFRACAGGGDAFDTTGETDVLTGTISATANSMQGASGFADATVPADNVLVIKTTAQTLNPDIWLRVEYTRD